MSETISISAIIPAFNAAQFLPAAIENIRAQNVDDLEIIVVDDGSSDNCEEVATRSGARYFRQENSGPAAARNAGLKLSRGEFIAFLDADDLWPPNSLQVRLDCLQQNPALQIALGKVQCLRDVPQAGSTPSAGESETQTELSKPFVSFNIGAALYRKSVFEMIGGFDADLRFGEDTDWFMRAREAAVSLLVLPQTTLHYRLHEGGMTSGKSAAQLNVAQVLKKSLDRRRQMQNENTNQNSAPASLPNLQVEKSATGQSE